MICKEISPGPDELKQLIALSEAWAAENSCYGYAANEAADFENKRIFAAAEEDKIVGYLYGHRAAAENMRSIIEDGAAYFEIEELYVAPELRSRGIGKTLFLFVQEKLAAEGLRYLRLTTATKDHDAIRRFYVDKVGMTPWCMTLYKKLAPTDAEKRNAFARIVPFEKKYRDDLIFMVLEAKNALGRVPTLNDDLLDPEGYYLKKGDRFWIALDENDRVIGCVGCNLLSDDEAVLHRLYVKYSMKRQGIGSALLETAESFARENGRKTMKVHLGDRRTYFESRAFYPKHGYRFVCDDHMEKTL